MLRILCIAIGGAGGALLRYWLAGKVQGWSNGSFPMGTLVVNVSGCLAIGLLATILPPGPVLMREEYRLGLLVGVLGGYTTFSTFAWETVQLANDREFLYGSVNILASVAAGLLATWGGSRLAQAIYGP